MDFYTARDLRTTPKELWDSLASSGEVVITSNGKPKALLVDISQDNFEEVLKALRQTRAMLAVNRMRKTAEANGFMTDEEIEAEIADARKGV